jgi:hypothetical protein
MKNTNVRTNVDGEDEERCWNGVMGNAMSRERLDEDARFIHEISKKDRGKRRRVAYY